MFEQPLSIIKASDHQLNPSLDNPKLPEPYQKRFGASIHQIAKNSLISGFEIPTPDMFVVDKNSDKQFPKTDAENIYPQLFGNVVEFLSAYMTAGKDKAECVYFPQACDHIDDLFYPDPNHPKDQNKSSKYYKKKNPDKRMTWDELSDERRQMIVDDLIRLSTLLNTIDADPMSEEGIRAACEFCAFHHSLHYGRKCYSGDDARNIKFKGEVVPTIKCARQIWRLVNRSIEWLDRAGVQSYQFSYPNSLLMSPTNGVNGGRLDFVANNIIVDLKTDRNQDFTEQNKLQILLYLALIQRVNTKKPVNVACILDPRTNKIVAYQWNKLPEKTIQQLNGLIDCLSWANLREYEQTDEEKAANEQVRKEIRHLLSV